MNRPPFLATVVLASFFAGTHGEAAERLRLATTTSTENSGLLAELIPPFEGDSGIEIDVIAVGSGKAIRLAANGDADVILSHAPVLEQAFIEAGTGINRREVMYNDFVLVGPPRDPAGVRGFSSVAEALRRDRVRRGRFRVPRRRIGNSPEGESPLAPRGGRALGGVVSSGRSGDGRGLADG